MDETEPIAELDAQFSSTDATPTAWVDARAQLEAAEIYSQTRWRFGDSERGERQA